MVYNLHKCEDENCFKVVPSNCQIRVTDWPLHQVLSCLKEVVIVLNTGRFCNIAYFDYIWVYNLEGDFIASASHSSLMSI